MKKKWHTFTWNCTMFSLWSKIVFCLGQVDYFAMTLNGRLNSGPISRPQNSVSISCALLVMFCPYVGAGAGRVIEQLSGIVEGRRSKRYWVTPLLWDCANSITLVGSLFVLLNVGVRTIHSLLSYNSDIYGSTIDRQYILCYVHWLHYVIWSTFATKLEIKHLTFTFPTFLKSKKQKQPDEQVLLTTCW